MKYSDRRLAKRFSLTIPMYIRPWKSAALEEKVESVNVSAFGVYFETDIPPSAGATMQIRLEMPLEITGDPTVEWQCLGKVTRIQPGISSHGLRGVGVRFEYYEVSPATLPASALLQNN